MSDPAQTLDYACLDVSQTRSGRPLSEIFAEEVATPRRVTQRVLAVIDILADAPKSDEELAQWVRFQLSRPNAYALVRPYTGLELGTVRTLTTNLNEIPIPAAQAGAPTPACPVEPRTRSIQLDPKPKKPRAKVCLRQLHK